MHLAIYHDMPCITHGIHSISPCTPTTHTSHVYIHLSMQLSTTVEVFDFKTETWVSRNTTGTPPLGLYNAAHALHGGLLQTSVCFYIYSAWEEPSIVYVHNIVTSTLAHKNFLSSS